jgi:hypothetical protein
MDRYRLPTDGSMVILRPGRNEPFGFDANIYGEVEEGAFLFVVENVWGQVGVGASTSPIPPSMAAPRTSPLPGPEATSLHTRETTADYVDRHQYPVGDPRHLSGGPFPAGEAAQQYPAGDPRNLSGVQYPAGDSRNLAGEPRGSYPAGDPRNSRDAAYPAGDPRNPADGPHNLAGVQYPDGEPRGLHPTGDPRNPSTTPGSPVGVTAGYPKLLRDSAGRNRPDTLAHNSAEEGKLRADGYTIEIPAPVGTL